MFIYNIHIHYVEATAYGYVHLHYVGGRDNRETLNRETPQPRNTTTEKNKNREMDL